MQFYALPDPASRSNFSINATQNIESRQDEQSETFSCNGKL